MKRKKQYENQLGAAMVEAGLIVALVASISVVAIQNAGDSAAETLCEVAGNIEKSNSDENLLTYDKAKNICTQDVRTLPPCLAGWGC